MSPLPLSTPNIPPALTLKTGSRLHFGPLSYRPQSGRHFGGCGLMISEPGIEIRVQVATEDEVTVRKVTEIDDGAGLDVPGDMPTRVIRFVTRFREYFQDQFSVPPTKIEVRQAIASHVGLGSGTQLALAVGQSLAILSGQSGLTVQEIARAMGRGARSAIGINGFQRGGLFVDGGKRTSNELGTPITRLELPNEWYFLIVRPLSVSGLHGEEEKAAFDQLGPMPESTTARLCQTLVMDLLPSIVSEDYPAASEALYTYGALAGEFFAPLQGGIFASPQMNKLATLLQSEQIRGVGQSSWGPTLFALMPNRETAELWRDRLRKEDVGQGVLIQIGEPLQHGAVLEFE
ncbi:hypothetical protein Pla110_12950 [Polystyrenella longa]|uniref:GHMP kinase N-terminal domain-containing protein n=1 Tax=Polystyrenella longa TaxID=2528007 RepID=A0A518CK73_9PLAN|nr:beta-ribofuranosylaminobenzene 5'-phosphate synthase family protein [Polystyrenella longa]QDU79584.1 hypothetical protein Pla110_12950 [Polystyrenella longa]